MLALARGVNLMIFTTSIFDMNIESHHCLFPVKRSNDIFITAIIHDRMDIKIFFGISGNS